MPAQSKKHEKRPAAFGLVVGTEPIGCQISTMDALVGPIGDGVHLLATVWRRFCGRKSSWRPASSLLLNFYDGPQIPESR